MICIGFRIFCRVLIVIVQNKRLFVKINSLYYHFPLVQKLLLTPYPVIASLTRNPSAIMVARGSRIKSGMTNLLVF